MKNTQITLASRPDGMVKATDFAIAKKEILQPGENQVTVETHYISIDPAMRGWMNEGTTYIKGVEIGTPMRAFTVGKVVSSTTRDFSEGDLVSGMWGVQTHATVDVKTLSKIELGTESISWHLGILGMPGMTAYFGLIEKGKPQKGETIFISGAAGIVGSTVGQIAKIYGCKVVGTAGSDEKCLYLQEKCGFDATINYKTENVDEMLSHHCPNGVDIFYDNVGGPLLDTVLTKLARGARVVICGAISQYNTKQFYGPSNYMKIVSARGILTGIIVFDYIAEYPTAVKQIKRWISEEKISYEEHLVEGIEKFPEALKMLFTGENFGKLTLKVK